MKRFIVITLLLVFCTFLFCQMKKDENIKVMTFNIRYGVAKDGPNSWENRQSILIDCLKKHQPDILGLQESLDFQIDSIQTAFPHWKKFGVGRYFNKELPDRPHASLGGESCKIFYDSTKFEIINDGTYWHSGTPNIPASQTWGNSLPRITTWGKIKSRKSGKILIVMNTHFHGGEPYVPNTTALMMQKWREIAGPIPTILMGDFNLGPASETHELFCGKTGNADERGNFIDCWQKLGKSEENAGTGHGYSGMKSQKRIDWILVTPNFDVENMEIIYDNENGRYPSDHYPVRADLRYFW
jgi:endonuclease/exonuclease/phosphatase family metal-dependent hydrolase